MSIQSNGSFLYGTQFNDSFPNPDVGTWTAILAMRIALPPLALGILLQLQTDDGGGGVTQYQFRFNTFENYEIRTPTPDDGTIPVTGPHAVDTHPPGVWAWLGYRGQVTNPGVGWAGTLEWFYIVDGETTLQVVRSLAVPDIRLAGQYFSEFLFNLDQDGLTVELESFRVWGVVKSDAELVAQTRTFESLDPVDQLHYAPFLNVATLAPSETNGAFWTGSPVDGVTRPSYPDDAPVVHDLVAVDGTASATEPAPSAELGSGPPPTPPIYPLMEYVVLSDYVSSSESFTAGDVLAPTDARLARLVEAGVPMLGYGTVVGAIETAIANYRSARRSVGAQASLLAWLIAGGVGSVSYEPYTVATVPDATANENRTILVTNGNAGLECLAVSNGTRWIAPTGVPIKADAWTVSTLTALGSLNYQNATVFCADGRAGDPTVAVAIGGFWIDIVTGNAITAA